MSPAQQIGEFLSTEPFAVVGASTNRSKYGNKVLRCFQQSSRDVIPVNPTAKTIEGLPAVAALSICHPVPHAVSIITPPEITEDIVRQAIELGIRHIWMQPGAESESAVRDCQKAGCNLIYGGPCVLVVLGYRESGE